MKNLGAKTVVAFVVFSTVAGYFLWQEHSAHIALAVPYLPYLLILLCPLMHIFMHHGHGGSHGAGDGLRGARGDEIETEREWQVAPIAKHGSLPKSERRDD
jgi:hypothetical protein